ncbi:MAG: (2Fe-2S)-binding protein, partial [Alphaproteobacteria bacterium]|nr:(2Fe-2S)-binding protein [Alphaproteobacteria bacterium]
MTYQRDKDLGTPRSASDRTVTVTIDGRRINMPEGSSVMRAAAELGQSIPKLCATDMLGSFGSCRLCLVEIEGMRGTPASCTTPVADGMIVRTQTER